MLMHHPHTASELARASICVARHIRAQRLRIGTTQQKLGQRVGDAFRQAHTYERGLGRVSAGHLYKIKVVLQTHITYFSC
jgi:transcriptional regulator with XRE-family HTH domain